MPTNCSAARQLTQGLRSASVGAKRVPLAHSTYKHSKSADLLRKSLLSTLRFGRCKTNIHWMFCTSCLAGPKFKSLIVQARTAFWAFDPGIILLQWKLSICYIDAADEKSDKLIWRLLNIHCTISQWDTKHPSFHAVFVWRKPPIF